PQTDSYFMDIAAMFAETGWREQPIYRALSQYNHVLGCSYVGVSHALRVKLATTAFVCQDGKLPKSIKPQVGRFLSEAEIAECKAIGSLFKLAQVLDPGAHGGLDQFALLRDNSGQYTLKAPSAFLAMASEEVAKILHTV